MASAIKFDLSPLPILNTTVLNLFRSTASFVAWRREEEKKGLKEEGSCAIKGK
jgi:hypothetical protein